MTGLELSRSYFQQVVQPRLQAELPELYGRLAAGLVGNGSDCFGYDDALSQDHDWGVDYFLWLPEELRDRIPFLEEWRRRLFAEQPPQEARQRSPYGAVVGVQTVGDFYRSLLGLPEGPDSLPRWLQTPETHLAMAVNGQVFWDGDGAFTAIRQRLLMHYPEDVRRKKLAAKCMAMAQTGQYNHLRMAQRGDWVTVRSILTRFSDNVMGAAFLLNRRYQPYYKWAFRALSELPLLGRDLAAPLRRLALSPDFSPISLRRQQEDIELCCALLQGELRRQGLSDSPDSFMAVHGEAIQSSIQDNLLRSLPATFEG